MKIPRVPERKESQVLLAPHQICLSRVKKKKCETFLNFENEQIVHGAIGAGVTHAYFKLS